MFWLKTVKLSKKPKKKSFQQFSPVFNQNIGFYWALQRFCFISLENHKILLLFIRNQEINVHWEAPGKPWEAPGGSGVLSGALGCSGELRRCLGGHGELWGALGIGKLSGALGGSGDLLDIYQSKGLKK
mgnify:CR=1 FL=1